MRQYEDDSRMNGFPSWPQLLEALDRWGMRIHERIDETQAGIHGKIDDLRDRVITIETRLEEDRQPRHRGRVARLRDWIELIAPLREVVFLLCVMAAAIAGLTQAPTVREAAKEAAGLLAPPELK